MRRLTLLLLFLLIPSAQAQDPRISGQYKRVHQMAFRAILQGKPEVALTSMEKILEKAPNEPESLYMTTVALTSLGKHEEAIARMKKAIQAGLPPGRFLAGALTGLEPLRKHPELKKLMAQFVHRPVHGPMLGCLTPTSIKVWVRTAGMATVQAIASTSSNLSNPVTSKVAQAKEESDYTAVVELKGLKPGTLYHYGLRINQPEKPTKYGTFRTLTNATNGIQLRLAFGGGAGYVPFHEHMWNTIHAKKSDVLLLLGDNVYIDDPKSPAMQHYTYYRRQSRPEYRNLLASTPVYSIWDDHDFGTNDCSGGPQVSTPAWKPKVWKVFQNNWVNPGYGKGATHPGCFYDFYLGDIHFVMLDGRYYRNLKKEDRGRSSMLGPKQRQWLLDTIAASKGTFLVLCSPVPWVFKAKGKSKDTWNGFQQERNEIFDALAKQKKDGVVLMSADRHRSDLWKIDRANGYPLYELNSSRLTNQHTHGVMKEAIFSYNKKPSFGLVEFDTTKKDPEVTYQIVNIDGKRIHTHTIKRSQLTSDR